MDDGVPAAAIDQIVPCILNREGRLRTPCLTELRLVVDEDGFQSDSISHWDGFNSLMTWDRKAISISG